MNFAILKTVAAVALAFAATASYAADKDFLHVNGHDIVDSRGEKFYIKGTNTGNWLNPEPPICSFTTIISTPFSSINKI